MHVIKRLNLRGHNIWAPVPMLEAWIDLQDAGDSAAAHPATEQFANLLLRQLPAAPRDLAPRARFVERLRTGMPLAEMIAELTLLLQIESGIEVRLVRVLPSTQEGVWKVACECRQHAIAEEALHASLELIESARASRPLENRDRLTQLATLVQQLHSNGVASAMRAAARTRDIPVQPLGDNGLCQFGHGVRQRRINGLQTDRTPATAMAAAADRSTTYAILETAGLPVPDADEPVADAVEYQLLIAADRLVAAVRVASQTGMSAVAQLPLEVTSLLHPTIVAQAREAARLLGLDVAGVVISTTDIGRPLDAVQGAIVAVESCPQFAATSGPLADIARRMADAVLDVVFPAGATARVPIIAVTGVNGKTTTIRLISHILGVTGRGVGMTCTDGIYIAGERISTGDCSGPQSARVVLGNPRVEAAVLETARGGLLREGVGFDRCDVAVVTNIGEGDHLGLGDITTPEQLARVKRTIVEAVAPGGAAVLNAEDPLVAQMQQHCPGAVIYFAVDAQHPVIAAWRAAGHRAVVVRDGSIVVAEGEREFPLLSLDRVPLTHQGRIRFQVENALAAVAATWSLGVPVELIRKGLESFAPTSDLVPGRFNLLEIDGATVVIDYGHNASALKTVLASLDQFPQQRRLCVYSAAGDRRDCDLVEQGEMIGNAFDRVVLYEDYYMRGRQPGEIIELFRQGLQAGSRVKEWRGVQGWTRALETALQWLRPGDLALIQADTIDSAVTTMKEYLTSHPLTREITLTEAMGATPAAPAAARSQTDRPAETGDRPLTHANGVPVAGAGVENRVLTHPL